MKRFGHNDIDRLGKILDELPPEPGKARHRRRRLLHGRRHRPARRPWSSCAGAHPNTFLLDDEAHGLGVLGARGRGAAEHYGVLADVDLITITFSKTLGSCGGALIGSADAIELLTLDADPLIFTASNTPGSVAAALAALRILREAPEMTGQLRDNVDPVRRPAHRARRPGEPGRERHHHHPAAPSATRCRRWCSPASCSRPACS